MTATQDASHATETVQCAAQPDKGLNVCSDCGAEVASIHGCPDGAEVCDDCFAQH